MSALIQREVCWCAAPKVRRCCRQRWWMACALASGTLLSGMVWPGGAAWAQAVSAPPTGQKAAQHTAAPATAHAAPTAPKVPGAPVQASARPQVVIVRANRCMPVPEAG